MHENILEFAKLKYFEHVACKRICFTETDASQFGEQLDRLIHRQILGQAVKLGTVAQVLTCLVALFAYRVSADHYVAMGGLQLACAHFERCRLARSIKTLFILQDFIFIFVVLSNSNYKLHLIN